MEVTMARVTRLLMIILFKTGLKSFPASTNFPIIIDDTDQAKKKIARGIG
jgi:hypothetical protein